MSHSQASCTLGTCRASIIKAEAPASVSPKLSKLSSSHSQPAFWALLVLQSFHTGLPAIFRCLVAEQTMATFFACDSSQDCRAGKREVRLSLHSTTSEPLQVSTLLLSPVARSEQVADLRISGLLLRLHSGLYILSLLSHVSGALCSRTSSQWTSDAPDCPPLPSVHTTEPCHWCSGRRTTSTSASACSMLTRHTKPPSLPSPSPKIPSSSKTASSTHNLSGPKPLSSLNRLRMRS